ncbi:hypothetical protein [Agrobacterium pusense]|uniref:hypothetical protein n=1 Tax=Agrobacterium pusense TaxID=648995 RepID=UPI00156ADC1F|nr:hypothetical protein [Agrobacterium pusense]QKJ92486.1 hypothetical protein HQN82_18030 [Agrobacterium pusense]
MPLNPTLISFATAGKTAKLAQAAKQRKTALFLISFPFLLISLSDEPPWPVWLVKYYSGLVLIYQMNVFSIHHSPGEYMVALNSVQVIESNVLPSPREKSRMGDRREMTR